MFVPSSRGTGLSRLDLEMNPLHFAENELCTKSNSSFTTPMNSLIHVVLSPIQDFWIIYSQVLYILFGLCLPYMQTMHSDLVAVSLLRCFFFLILITLLVWILLPWKSCYLLCVIIWDLQMNSIWSKFIRHFSFTYKLSSFFFYVVQYQLP